ncbi:MULTISPECIES: restriction endonuclease [unclassified Ruegeria]|uniref:restriction endonuclease n=1 Tax=unclassified Ruegeria TaxID=2625375 RepID=UPI00148785AD|nr:MULTISPECIES: restriction endonuclease [unclassified Ruegeria]
MPVLDFKEIPEAHIASGLQDTFELFARDFLVFMGFRIISAPDRGADGGKDIIAEETRVGVGGETTIKWLVSCKHKASTGKSVSPTDETNIMDRVISKKCDAFLGFYSTLPSTGLNTVLEGMNFEQTVYDRERIESQLLHSSKGLQIAERYFPRSLESWKTNNPQPAQLFADQASLNCHVCNKDLLDHGSDGIVTLWQTMKNGDYSKPDFFESVCWTCRGHCDQVLRKQKHKEDLIDSWEDISDIKIPTVFLKWVISVLNDQRTDVAYSDEAFESLKQLLLTVFPHVARDLSTKEKERMSALVQIPAHFGGMGF